MDAEAIQEIANQLGIAATAVTKDVIPAYAQYMIATKASKAALFVIIAISLLVLARFAISKSKKYAN